MENMAFAGIDELAVALRRGEVSAVELAEAALESVERLDPRLNVIVRTTQDRAMAEARAADERLASDSQAPLLCGIPYMAKDIFDVAGEVTGGGCPVLLGNVAERDSTAVARLSAAGMVLVAKTRTSPLACEITGLNHTEGAPRNPWMAEPHVAGGSSSGSAVAVAAGIVPVALASDTGGSVRTPAALCGLTGLRPTLGQVSRAGVLPLAGSHDVVGPLVRSARDASHVFSALRGRDPADPTTSAATDPETVTTDLSGLRLVIAEGRMFEDVDPEIEAAVREAARTFQDYGGKVESREMPILAEEELAEARSTLLSGEAWQNNGNIRAAWGDDLDPLANWIFDGANISEAEIERARGVQKRYQARFLEKIGDVDALIMPTTGLTARPIAEVETDYETHSNADVRNTSTGNFLNLCAVSMPCGLDTAGRPIGMSLCARPFADDRLLGIVAAWQAATSHLDCRPLTAA